MGATIKLTNTRSDPLILAADYYDLQLDDYFYDVLTAGEESCKESAWVCETIERTMIPKDDETILNDDPEAAVRSTKNYPAGRPGNSIDHYMQNMREDRFQYYAKNYSTFWKASKNNTTKRFPLEDITVPMAIFSGINDTISTLKDVHWARDQINSLVHYEELPGGHFNFVMGKDMSFFPNSVIPLFNKYHPLEHDSTNSHDEDAADTADAADAKTTEDAVDEDGIELDEVELDILH